MTKQYFNAFDTDGSTHIQSEALTYDEAVEEVKDYDGYQYTVEVDGYESKILNLHEDAKSTYDSKPYERVTGHDYGTNSGRV